jgi:hypothetical protein
MQWEKASAPVPCVGAGETLPEKLRRVFVVEAATLAILGEAPPPQPAATRARDTSTAIPTVEPARSSPLRVVSPVATRTSRRKTRAAETALKIR